MDKQILFCKHKETHVRLASWATRCNGQHEQGFNHQVTCKACGSIVASLDKGRAK